MVRQFIENTVSDFRRLRDGGVGYSSPFGGPVRLVFPEDLNRTSLGRLNADSVEVPYMTMGFSSYERRSIYQQPFYRDVMRIALPIPDNLSEQTSVSYDKSTQLDSVAGSVVEGMSQGVPANLREGLRSAETVATGIAASAIRNLANAVSPNIGNAASVLGGITRNPFQVVLFKSPEFRAHTFSWQFAPKNRNETDLVNSIIRAFRYHSLPGILGAGGVVFSYPEILTINFRPQETANYMYEFKPCVVESVAVNYTPNGPSFFNKTGAPTAIQFTIRVQEIEIWTKADFLRNPQGIFNNATISGSFFEPP